MKTFIVYNLDTGLPIAVGEAIKAEWARVETAEETDIRAEDLIAEEISLGKESNFCETGLHDANEVCSLVCIRFACVGISSVRGVKTAFSSQTRGAN